jgi:hypothetical protein
VVYSGREPRHGIAVRRPLVLSLVRRRHIYQKLLGLVAIASVVGSRTAAGIAVNYWALLVRYNKKGSTSWDSCDDLGTDFDAAPGASHLQFR